MDEAVPVSEPEPPPVVLPAPAGDPAWRRYAVPVAIGAALAVLIAAGVYFGPRLIAKKPAAIEADHAPSPAPPEEPKPQAIAAVAEQPIPLPQPAATEAPPPAVPPAVPDRGAGNRRQQAETEQREKAQQQAETQRRAEAERQTAERALAEQSAALERAAAVERAALERAAAEKAEANRVAAAQAAALQARRDAEVKAAIMPPPPPPPPQAPSGPSSGALTWRGTLGKTDTVTISGSTASLGGVSGVPLPGLPVILEAPPGCLVSATPMRGTGYREFSFRCNKSGNLTIEFRWSKPNI